MDMSVLPRPRPSSGLAHTHLVLLAVIPGLALCGSTLWLCVDQSSTQVGMHADTRAFGKVAQPQDSRNSTQMQGLCAINDALPSSALTPTLFVASGRDLPLHASLLRDSSSISVATQTHLQGSAMPQPHEPANQALLPPSGAKSGPVSTEPATQIG